MSLSTKSAFYYGHTVTESNSFLNFDEGGGELTATLNVDDYTLTDFAIEVARAMTEAGGQDYTVAVDRDTRVLTVSATSNFDLLTNSGSTAGSAPWDLMGFSTAADKTGTNSYVGDTGSGSEYLPQYWLQQYKPFTSSKRKASASVNTTATGVTEVISFGLEQFMECNIKYATDIDQGTGNPIDTNATGYDDLEDFLDYIITKAEIEFMPDKDTRSTFDKCFLESTPTDSKGIGYSIEELFSENLADYYETGLLKFKKVT